MARILLRNGKKISVGFSGRHPCPVELGHLLGIELTPKLSRTTSVYRAREWNLLWIPSRIRTHEVFYQVCFILEVIERISLSTHLQDPLFSSDNEWASLFSVASNALYRLNEESGHGHLLLFLGKLLIALGIFPQLNNCLVCKKSLSDKKILSLDQKEGGFLCQICSTKDSFILPHGQKLRLFLKEISRKKYGEISLSWSDSVSIHCLFDYLCHHLNLHQNRFKSLSLAL